jgi:hypothetical protein
MSSIYNPCLLNIIIVEVTPTLAISIWLFYVGQRQIIEDMWDFQAGMWDNVVYFYQHHRL